jgi:hypothetical protein
LPSALCFAAQWSEQTGKTFDDAYLVDIEVGQTIGCLFSAAFLDEFAKNVRQLINRRHIWGCVGAVARKLIEQGTLSSQEVTDIISVSWEELDGDEQELIIGKQQSDGSQRPWGEWRPE